MLRHLSVDAALLCERFSRPSIARSVVDCAYQGMLPHLFLTLPQILALFAFAYVTLVGSLAISHNLLHRRAYFKATVELLFSHALITGATWSFLVAVFREAGSPRRSAEDDLESVMLDDTDTSRRRPRKHRPAGESSAGYEEDSDDDNEYDESGDSAGVSRDESQSAPLLGAGSGASALLPGQPRLPARSATSQLDDVRAAVETARTGASAEAQAEPRTLIHGAGLMVKSTGERRWCNKCGCAKPDRAHHCSTCGVCVLRVSCWQAGALAPAVVHDLIQTRIVKHSR